MKAVFYFSDDLVVKVETDSATRVVKYTATKPGAEPGAPVELKRNEARAFGSAVMAGASEI